MENNNMARGHLAAIFTILVWGTTFISTKLLLKDFGPVEILFIRFMMGLAALLVAYPRRLKGTVLHQEVTFALAGLCGVTLYYLLENIALTYTMASNVGVICSVAPFFTAIFTHFFVKNGERLNKKFFIGFAVALVGIILINFNGSTNFEVNPIGDFLALAAAVVWAIYAILSKKISTYGYNVVQTTRRIFLYGIVFMIPALFLLDFHPNMRLFLKPVNMFNILYLGLCACALCFVTWNSAVKILGALKTSVYIYLIPIITIVTSVIILHERITWMSGIGTVLTLSGLVLSEKK